VWVTSFFYRKLFGAGRWRSCLGLVMMGAKLFCHSAIIPLSGVAQLRVKRWACGDELATIDWKLIGAFIFTFGALLGALLGSFDI